MVTAQQSPATFETRARQLKDRLEATPDQYKKQRFNHAVNKATLMHAPVGRQQNYRRTAIAIIIGFALLIVAVIFDCGLYCQRRR